MKDEASELDRTLSSGSGQSDSGPLVEIARELVTSYGVEPPVATRERTLFVEGIAAQRRRPPWLLIAAPTAALAGVFVLFLALAGRALPGDSLYAVREVMGSVGLARPAASDIREVVHEASERVTAARLAADEAPRRARRHAVFALGRLGVAREWLSHLRGGSRGALLAEIERIERQALAALFLASEEAERLEERAERIEERLEGSDDGDDSSGPGSGDESDDSSGPGSGDEPHDDDSSGSGSDDDSDGSGSEGDDDRSGSGDDSSGSDSGDNDSSGSGSGDDDSSGSGSGEEEDRSGSDSGELEDELDEAEDD